MGMCQQKLQAKFDINQDVTAQKYIDEIVRPHVDPHIDNNALTDSTVLMQGGAKPQTTRIRRVDKFLSMRTASCCQPKIQILVSFMVD